MPRAQIQREIFVVTAWSPRGWGWGYPSALIVIVCRIRIETLPNPSPFTFAPVCRLFPFWAFNHPSWCNYPMQRIKTLYEPKIALLVVRSSAVALHLLGTPLTLPPCFFRDRAEMVFAPVMPCRFHALKKIRWHFPRSVERPLVLPSCFMRQ